MRYEIIAAAVLALTLGSLGGVLASEEHGVGASSSPDTPTAAEPITEEPGQRGLSLLPESRFNSGRSVVFDVVSTGDQLVAVGYGRALELGTGKTHGAAWTSDDGRTWRKTHRVGEWTFDRAVPAADGSILASRGTSNGCYRLWRLEPDGRAVRSAVIWPNGPCSPGRGQEVIALAGKPTTGMVAVYGGLDRRLRPQVLARAPGSRWERVRVPSFGQAHGFPVEVVETSVGFVLLAEDREGIKVWRSRDGVAWSPPELLPDSAVGKAPDAPTTTVYDKARDILLVLAAPDRVWRSVEGGSFEVMGPLAASVVTDTSRIVGTSLADGFLVATSDGDGLRLQTSPDGATWTRAAAGPDDSRGGDLTWMVTHGDVVIAGSEVGGRIMAGPATLAAYPPAP
jgi:hypothetical protein